MRKGERCCDMCDIESLKFCEGDAAEGVFGSKGEDRSVNSPIIILYDCNENPIVRKIGF